MASVILPDGFVYDKEEKTSRPRPEQFPQLPFIRLPCDFC